MREIPKVPPICGRCMGTGKEPSACVSFVEPCKLCYGATVREYALHVIGERIKDVFWRDQTEKER